MNTTVPLVVFEPPCGFRDAAIEALNRAGRAWEIVFTSPSLSGLRAAVEAGLGFTARTLSSFEGRLHPLPVAACNHRAFCSQSSAIPAQIKCE